MLCELAEDKLVVSHTGRRAVPVLARKPAQISLLDVYGCLSARIFSHFIRNVPATAVPWGQVLAGIEECEGEIDSAIEDVLGRIR